MSQGVRIYDFVTIDKVVDGDTVDAQVDMGFFSFTKERFRLARINTPERGQPGFDEATSFVRDWCAARPVRFRVTKTDKFRRWLVEIDDKATGENLNDALLGRGLAKHYAE